METKKTNGVLKFFASKAGGITITAVCVFAVLGILVALLEANVTWAIVLGLAICTFFGWRALNRITPSLFIFGNMDFWVMYFIIKGMLAAMVGMFVAPFQIGKAVSGFISGLIQDSDYEKKGGWRALRDQARLSDLCNINRNKEK